MEFSLNKHGFVTKWLVAGPVSGRYEPPDLPKTWSDQLEYERTLRRHFRTEPPQSPPQRIKIGQTAPNGAPWRYFHSAGNWFVDVCDFYNLPVSVELEAAAVLVSETEQTCPAVLWTYASVDLWVNGTHVLNARNPVYKPIQKYDAGLPLRKGENTVYVRMRNLGIRDTRSLFGLQLPDTGVSVSLTDAEGSAPAAALDRWLSKLSCAGGTLTVPSSPPCEVFLLLPECEPTALTAGTWNIPDNVYRFTVEGKADGNTLSRVFEIPEHVHSSYAAPSTNPRRQFLEHIAAKEREPRGSGVYFSVYHVLARRLLGRDTQADENLLMQDLDFIQERGDCADFLVNGFIRLLKGFETSDRLKARAKEVLLSFRYWMDEDGSDGMCFWSENHALMFYSAQLLVGDLYPDDLFTRSGRTGREQSALGAARCRDWLSDMEAGGSEEFNSGTYLPVTVAVLLNLIDFAPEDISLRSSAVLDDLLRRLCLHVFHGTAVSPQGRAYRDVVYPSLQNVQSLLHMIDSSFPYTDGENGWMVPLFNSRYRFPEDLAELCRQDADCSYTSGNARIFLKKTNDYTLTSVCSPRTGEDDSRWPNLCFDGRADKNSNAYVKSLNERFHGTSSFEPGVYGYQQHLWYSALDNECVVFTNHPGSAADLTEMRPGYWFGNGVFPAIAQRGNVLGAVYVIPDDHPIPFTHVFWPAAKFTANLLDGCWLFGKKGTGYIGLWCSGKPIAADTVLTGCEYRISGPQCAYYCVCGSEREFTFPEFMAHCKAQRPDYDAKSRTLTAEDGFQLTFTAHTDKTQYV